MVCIPNKTEDLNLHVFNMITEINETKTLIKDISCECKCEFNGRKCNLNYKWNNDKFRCECKNPKEHHVCKNDYICHNATTCSCENGKYLASIMDDSVIKFVENIETTKTVPAKTVPTKSTSTNFYILVVFLLTTIALLIAVCIYCYLIKYRAK